VRTKNTEQVNRDATASTTQDSGLIALNSVKTLYLRDFQKLQHTKEPYLIMLLHHGAVRFVHPSYGLIHIYDMIAITLTTVTY
jgi:hypothetical protein